MRDIFFVAIAGAAGALCRWGAGVLAGRVLGQDFPYGTLIVNVLGCFLLGFVMHLGLTTDLIPQSARIAITVGFLGALTTFSTFGYETIKLLEDSAWLTAAGNVVLNLVLGLAAAVGGLTLGKAIVGGTG
ncbi:MAG: fluoride efflux transporter CrcB [Sedimentisphaerales bacterium]|nr:fluoride efflux transporter CrcB [Sedimentisphaerales bacterium]